MVNPFFEKYTTPHQTPPFNLIKMEHYEEAFMEGIRRDDEHIEKLINNPEPPTFDNTIIDTEDDNGYYDLLDNVSTVFFNLLSAETNDEMDALAQKLQPILTKHANDVRLNKQLFERIKAVYDLYNNPVEGAPAPRELTAEEQRLLEKSYDGFVRSGALLDEAGKEKLRAISEEASMLGLQFSQNLLKEKKAFKLHITDEADLAGLPDTQIQAAALAAKENNLEGWVFTLDFPSYSPFMQYSEKRELRKKMFMAYNTICTHDNEQNNIEICKRLINLRRELAQLLGYETYADYVLKHRMAANIQNVYNLLDQLVEAYKPTALKEKEELRNMARKAMGDDFELEPWDGAFYSHKLQLEKYNVDSEMVRPYLELKNVIKGVFGLATRLYGITFKENKDIPVYHPDVKAYEVFDKDGAYLAVLLADFHPSKGK
jgi:peptidyl-dipeptidase Dcp